MEPKPSRIKKFVSRVIDKVTNPKQPVLVSKELMAEAELADKWLTEFKESDDNLTKTILVFPPENES